MLFRLLKSVSKWVYEGFEGIAAAEERLYKSILKGEDKNESK